MNRKQFFKSLVGGIGAGLFALKSLPEDRFEPLIRNWKSYDTKSTLTLGMKVNGWTAPGGYCFLSSMNGISKQAHKNIRIALASRNVQPHHKVIFEAIVMPDDSVTLYNLGRFV